jgi:hypothetical protein
MVRHDTPRYIALTRGGNDTSALQAWGYGIVIATTLMRPSWGTSHGDRPVLRLAPPSLGRGARDPYVQSLPVLPLDEVHGAIVACPVGPISRPLSHDAPTGHGKTPRQGEWACRGVWESGRSDGNDQPVGPRWG